MGNYKLLGIFQARLNTRYGVLRDNKVNSVVIPGNKLQYLSGTFHNECFYETRHTLFTRQEKEIT